MGAFFYYKKDLKDHCIYAYKILSQFPYANYF